MDLPVIADPRRRVAGCSGSYQWFICSNIASMFSVPLSHLVLDGHGALSLQPRKMINILGQPHKQGTGGMAFDVDITHSLRLLIRPGLQIHNVAWVAIHAPMHPYPHQLGYFLVTIAMVQWPWPRYVVLVSNFCSCFSSFRMCTSARQPGRQSGSQADR